MPGASSGEPGNARGTAASAHGHRSAQGRAQGQHCPLHGQERTTQPIRCHTREKGYVLPHCDLSDKVIEKKNISISIYYFGL